MSASSLLSGPSAKRYLSNAGTGLSDAGASFIAANCSPFSPPNEFVTGPPKVPDARNRIETGTTYIYSTMQIPIQADGNQMILVNANPLSPLPIAWARETTQLIYSEEPIQWAQAYSAYGLGQFLSQTKALADASQSHRIVGCAVKARITDPTNAHSARGQVEGGQFDVASTRYTTPTNATSVARSTIDNSSLGAFGSAWNSAVYATMKRSIQNSISHSHGFGDVQEGIAVRWTDKNQFKFVPTIYSNVIAPSATFFTNGFAPFQPISNASAVAGETGTPQWDQTLGTYNVDATAIRNTFYAIPPTINVAWFADGGAPQQAVGTSDVLYCFQNNWSGTTLPNGIGSRVGSNLVGSIHRYGNFDTTRYPLTNGSEQTIKWTDSEQNFGDGLYIDITGCSNTQTCVLEVVWHVEYVPKMAALDYGLASPVDLNYDALAAIAGDETSFPVVTQSDGFFKSLQRGMSDASDGLARMLGRTSSLRGT